MYRSPVCNNSAIPDEYPAIAENLFPTERASSQTENKPAAAEFANALGIGAEYKKLFDIGKSDSGMKSLLDNFQNNLDLLIQKTWVEKADEARKEKLQDKVPGFIAGIEQKNLHTAVKEFGVILEELAYLFFGAQSTRDDFSEYTFRIDTQMGLFWWYGSRLCGMNESGTDENLDDESLWAVLLVGICYLTNF